MRFDSSKLRTPEWLIGAASALLLLDTFLVAWYAIGGQVQPGLFVQFPHSSVDAWHALTVVRFLILLTALLGIAVWWLQATREAPAVPTVLTEVAIIPAGLLLLALIWRVLIDVPGIYGIRTQFVEVKLGAYLGLLFDAIIVVGVYRSLRQDYAPQEAAAKIERLSLHGGLAERSP